MSQTAYSAYSVPPSCWNRVLLFMWKVKKKKKSPKSKQSAKHLPGGVDTDLEEEPLIYVAAPEACVCARVCVFTVH